ncbi:MAG TPA: SDR family oxidoreductase [Ktedonobacteraceae bacterium]
MYTYTGKAALITGASSGIGEAFAQELAKRGMHTVLVARSEGSLRKLASELTKQHGVRSEVIVADLSQEKASVQIKTAVEEMRLHVDLLVNNAGFATHDAFDAIDPERDHQQVMVNVTAVVDLAHAFLPEMVARGAGAMINVASMAAFMPMPYMAVYAASKAFVLSFSEALWAEYRERGIQVVALCPGEVETRFHQALEHPVPAAGVKRSSQQVVREALYTLEKGKSSVIPGILNDMTIQSTRLMSRSFLARGAESRLRPAVRKQ